MTTESGRGRFGAEGGFEAGSDTWVTWILVAPEPACLLEREEMGR